MTQCEVRTLQTDDEELDFPGAFRETKTLNRILISAEAFREALVELFDLPGASTVSVLVSPQVPHFRLAALGAYGNTLNVAPPLCVFAPPLPLPLLPCPARPVVRFLWSLPRTHSA